MFPDQKIDWKCELAPNCNLAVEDVSAQDGAGIPSIDKQEDALKGNPIRVAFVAHDS
jgi:hypothetical protein